MLSLFPGERKCDTLQRLPMEVSFWGHHGYLLPHHRSMAFYTTDNINGGEVFISGFLPEVVTRRPTSFGVGYYYSNMGSREVYGRVHGLYTAIEADFCRFRLPFIRWPFYFRQTTAFGLSYNTERFDIGNNYSNRAIGSHLNAYVSVSVDFVVQINDRLSISAGPSAVHTSNGNIRHPNFGLNLANARAGLSYKIQSPFSSENTVSGEILPSGTSETTDHIALPRKNSPFRAQRLQIITSGGIRQLSHKIRENFFVGSLLADYSYRIHRYQAWGVGVDFIWDATEGRETYVTEPRVENIVPWHIGVHLTWERIWNRFSMVLQPGYKVVTLSEHSFMQYNRAGIRYRPRENIILSCAIKAHEFRADFIEFGVGVEIGE